jgi:hypothetical protein
MMPDTSTCRRRLGTVQADRSGLLVVAALVCLLVVTSIVAAMLHSAVRARRALHVERDRRQAELLVEAGADRAVARLASDPEYRGDTWAIDSSFIVNLGDGRVTTSISRSADTEPWQLHIVVEYPLNREFPIRRSHTYKIASSPAQIQE